MESESDSSIASHAEAPHSTTSHKSSSKKRKHKEHKDGKSKKEKKEKSKKYRTRSRDHSRDAKDRVRGSRESRDSREPRDARDGPRDAPRDPREVARDSRDPQDVRDPRDTKDVHPCERDIMRRDYDPRNYPSHLRDGRDARDVRDVRDLRDVRDRRDYDKRVDSHDRERERERDLREKCRSTERDHDRRPPPPPLHREDRGRNERRNDRRDERRDDRRDSRPRSTVPPPPPPMPVTDLSKLAGVEVVSTSSTTPKTPTIAKPAPAPARTATPEPDAAPQVQPSAASVMESLSVEDKVRQRKERIEKWRLERLAKEQPEALLTANADGTTITSTSTPSTAANRTGGAMVVDETRKTWNLEDDSDEEEGAKESTTFTAPLPSATTSTFQAPLRPLSAKVVDDDTLAFGAAAFKKPYLPASAATAAKKPSPFGSNFKPASTKLNPFGSSFSSKPIGSSLKPGASVGVTVKRSAFEDDEDDNAQTEAVELSARGKKLKGIALESAAASAIAAANGTTTTTTTVAVDTKMDVDEEEADELEAFMVDVNSEVKKLAEEDLKVLKSAQTPVTATSTVKSVIGSDGTIMETDSVAGDVRIIGEDNEDGAEKISDDDDDILGAAAKLIAGKRKDLTQVDHSVQNYKEFRKDFYVEPPEISEMAEAEVEIKRAELGGIKIRGIKCPKPIEKWTQMGLPTSVGDVIKKGLKYEKPSSIQSQAIPAIMSGRDVIGIAKTGSGKTIAFLLPMFRHIKDQDPLKTGDGSIALIMTPTRELAVQIHREAKLFTKALNLKSVCCYGGAPIKDQIAELKRGAEIIICTPGRMIDLLCANSGRVTNLKRVTYLVLDEADRMFDMGFEPQVMKMVNNIRPSRQTILFSATFPRKMEALARKILVKPLEITVGGRSTVCSDVHQIVEVRAEDSKFLRTLEILGDCFANDPDAKILIFVDRHESADNLLRDLLKRGYPCQSLHGGKDQADRQSTFQDFKTGDTNIVIATSVAARGLDVKQLKIVINYECPNHMEDYVHRCGRTGRAGNKGIAYTFITPDQDKYAVDIVQALKMSSVEVPADVQALADSFIAKVKAGTANYSSSGFGGKGLDKLDKERDAVKQYQKKSHGAGFEEDEDDDDSDAGGGKGGDGGDDSDAFTDEEEDNDVFSFKTTTVRSGAGGVVGGGKSDKEREEAIAAAAAAAASAAAAVGDGGPLDEIEKAKRAIAEANAKLGQEGLNKAKDIIALINKKLGPAGTSADVAGAKRTAGEAPFAIEIEINDYPQKARWKVTNKEMINQITEISGAAITTRGLFFDKGKPVPTGQRKLYLFIEADTQLQIDRAKKEIKRILKEATMMAMEAEASMGGGGRYLVTNG
ncbi:UNVERIFIED_CONTAM: pre-mRNA processing RNA-helicase [Siphonaria sp. JEL0065]|nr:pre-mRNA processing RNA-helicase [Siphonaria sp. JEL0065]